MALAFEFAVTSSSIEASPEERLLSVSISYIYIYIYIYIMLRFDIQLRERKQPSVKAQAMARTTLSNQHSRRVASRTQTTHDQTRQRRHQHRAPPKRSVSSLSATQLERKRATDREAQRLIRQRTKDRIDDLEKQISNLRVENERLNRCLRQRSTQDSDAVRKRSNFEGGSTPWDYSKVVNVPHCLDVALQDGCSSFSLSLAVSFSHLC